MRCTADQFTNWAAFDKLCNIWSIAQCICNRVRVKVRTSVRVSLRISVKVRLAQLAKCAAHLVKHAARLVKYAD